MKLNGQAAISSDLKVSIAKNSSRAFLLRCQITNASTLNAGIVEPVVLGNELLILGRHIGTDTVTLTLDSGSKLAISTTVIETPIEPVNGSNKDDSFIPGTSIPSVTLNEVIGNQQINLNRGEQKMFKLKGSLIRVFISDPSVLLLIPTKTSACLKGLREGTATLVTWDYLGGLNKYTVSVNSKQNTSSVLLPEHSECETNFPKNKDADEQKSSTSNFQTAPSDELEYWEAERKYIHFVN